MVSLLRLEREQTNSSNPFRISIVLFLSYSFGIETINTFLHSRSSLKTISDSRPKRRKNPTGWDGTYLYNFSKGGPHPGQNTQAGSFKRKIARMIRHGLQIRNVANRIVVMYMLAQS